MLWEPARREAGDGAGVLERHVAFDGLAHGVGEVHDVVARHDLEGVGGPLFQGVGGVAGPVGGFEVEVAAEEGVEGWAGGVGHVGVGGGGAVVPFVVFAGAGEGGQGGVDVGLFGGWGLRRVGGWGGGG